MAKNKKIVDISNVPAGQQKLIKGIVNKSGGGPHNVGSKEKYTEGNFAEYHHTKMYNSPLYYGEGKPAMGGGNFKASDTNKEVFDNAVKANTKSDETKKSGSDDTKKSGSDRLSAARSKRREARRNLKADRINRRAKRMEDRRR